MNHDDIETKEPVVSNDNTTPSGAPANDENVNSIQIKRLLVYLLKFGFIVVVMNIPIFRGENATSMYLILKKDLVIIVGRQAIWQDFVL